MNPPSRAESASQRGPWRQQLGPKAKQVDVPENLEVWNLRGFLNDYRCLLLGGQRLSSKEWSSRCREELGISHGKFFELLKSLETSEKVQKSQVDRKWGRIYPRSRNSNDEKDQ